MRCVSLFSGCGGLDLGVQQAGFDLVFATDHNSLCAQSHARNFAAVPFVEASIADLRIEDHLGGAEGQIDLLVGGPPCPPFSKSRFYLKDKPRALDDPVADMTLRGYLRALEILRPRAFLLENVPGLGYSAHRSALELIESEAGRLGYVTNWAVLNSADYGVPQIRQRFFMIGSKDGKVEMPEPTHSKPGLEDESSLPPWVTAGEVLADLDTEDNASDEGHFAGGKHHSLLCEVPPGDNYLYFTAKRGHPDPQFEWRSRYWSFLLKLSPDLPSWTIQASRSSNMGPFHWRNRVLRIAEIMRIQTFPDDWYLAGRVDEQWRQVGNAVPPQLAKHLGARIADELE